MFIHLCKKMLEHECYKFIFSSSATVYGKPKTVPIKEDFPLSVTNPYGRTKLMQEEIFRDFYVADKEWNIIENILEDYDLPELTPEEAEEIDRLKEDDEPGVPLQVVLAQYGMSVE